MLKHIIALSVIFAFSWIAWALLSLVVTLRTEDLGETNRGEVSQLWGSEHIQKAPRATATWKEKVRRPFTQEEINSYVSRRQKAEIAIADSNKREAREVAPDPDELFAEELAQRDLKLEMDRTEVQADIAVGHRQKGLLWFSTYTVRFRARYAVTNPLEIPVEMQISAPFPSASAVYDNMALTFENDSQSPKLRTTTENGQLTGRFTLAPGATQAFAFCYDSRGLDSWRYRFGEEVREVKDLRVVLRTNFEDIDFPQGSISPDQKNPAPQGGYELVWEKKSLVSGLQIGLLMPHRIDPGPLAASMSLHAPVSLFFFFFVLFMIQALKKIRIHPMNYFFLAASFFSFNLLFSYLVDHLALVPAFAVSSVVSILLVIFYLRIVVGAKFAVFTAGTCQLVYQVLFGVAHFFDGYTGLTITLGAIATLALVMQITAHLDWEHLFRRQQPSSDTLAQKAG